MTTREYTAISTREAWHGLVAGLVLAAVLGLISLALSSDAGPPVTWGDEAAVRAAGDWR